MADHEKKIITALFEIEGLAEELDLTLDKMDEEDSKVKKFIEQEKAIHKIKKIAKEYAVIDKEEAKECKECARKLTADVKGQEKALEDIAKEAEKLDGELDKVSDDDGKVKSFILQKKVMHRVKKILKDVGLMEDYTDDEIENL